SPAGSSPSRTSWGPSPPHEPSRTHSHYRALGGGHASARWLFSSPPDDVFPRYINSPRGPNERTRAGGTFVPERPPPVGPWRPAGCAAATPSGPGGQRRGEVAARTRACCSRGSSTAVPPQNSTSVATATTCII